MDVNLCKKKIEKKKKSFKSNFILMWLRLNFRERVHRVFIGVMSNKMSQKVIFIIKFIS